MAFSAHLNQPTCYRSMKSPKQDGPAVCLYSMIFVLIFNAMMGVCGYLAFGQATMGDITLNFPASYIMMMIGRIGMCVSVFNIFVMLFILVRESIEAEVTLSRKLPFTFSRKQSFLFSLVWIAATALIGWMTPGVEVALGFIGCTLGATSAYILPGYLSLKLLNKSVMDRRCAYVLLGAGFFTLVTGMYANIVKIA